MRIQRFRSASASDANAVTKLSISAPITISAPIVPPVSTISAPSTQPCNSTSPTEPQSPDPSTDTSPHTTSPSEYSFDPATDPAPDPAPDPALDPAPDLSSVPAHTRLQSTDSEPLSYSCPSCKQPFKRASSAGSRIPATVPEESVSRGSHTCPTVEERLDKLTGQVKELAKENRELKLEVIKIYSILCQKGQGMDGSESGSNTLRRIRKIDIGQPTNFQHTSHLGSNEVTTKIDTLEVAMKNKGGYMPGVSSYNSEPAMPTRPIRREE